MAISWNLSTDAEVEYDEFLDHFRAQGKDVLRIALDDSALIMRRLVNNRHFLTAELNRRLKNLKTFQTGNLYTPQVFLLHTDENFFIRANIWEPLRQRRGEGLFFYDVPHDHNFTFLTAGYHGSGYRTRIYEYDHAKVVGLADEPVELRFLEETTLPQGKVMLFRESIDIHTQIPPDELSISINVLKRWGHQRPDQYSFDLSRSEIIGKLDNFPNGLVLRLASALADDNTLDVLSQITKAHPCRRTRLQAFETLANRQGGQVWEEALADADLLVRTMAEKHLAAGRYSDVAFTADFRVRSPGTG